MSITTEVERDIFQTDTDISGNLTLINGNVGTGTTSPLCLLEINGTDPRLRITDTINRTPQLEFKRDPSSNFGGGIYGDWRIYNSGANLNFKSGDSSTGIHDRMTMTYTGNIGIGTSIPFCPLTINAASTASNAGGSNQPQIGSSSYYLNAHGAGAGGGPYTYTQTSASLSIWAYGNIMSYYGFIWGSDRRIKTDIVEVNDSRALDMVNKIESKEYHYSDHLRRKEMKTIGFIAQEVKEVFPNAVSLQQEYIPDELRIIEDPQWSQDNSCNILTINDLDLSGNHSGYCKFYVSNDPSGNDEVFKEIMVEDDKQSFIFQEKWNNVFFYGKQINDFHALDKGQIFALHHSAIQELSRKNDAKEQRIQQLETENAQLKADMALVKQKLGL